MFGLAFKLACLVVDRFLNPLRVAADVADEGHGVGDRENEAATVALFAEFAVNFAVAPDPSGQSDFQFLRGEIPAGCE